MLHAAATRVAAKVQAALPQTLWVQPTLAFFRTAALLSNGCYSGDAPPCRARMAAMLAADGWPSAEISRDHTRLPEITRDCPRSHVRRRWPA